MMCGGVFIYLLLLLLSVVCERVGLITKKQRMPQRKHKKSNSANGVVAQQGVQWKVLVLCYVI